MKTLKQWYDSLSEDAQLRLRINCTAWLDISEEDYYRKLRLSSLSELTNGIIKCNQYSNSDRADLFMLAFMQELKANHDEKTFNDYCALLTHQYVDIEDVYSDLPKDFWMLFDDRNKQKEMFKICYQTRQHALTLYNQLFFVEDFDNIPQYIDLEHGMFTEQLSDVTVEIFGREIIRNYLKIKPLDMLFETGKESKLFDDLFFCEDGWTEEQKNHFLDYRYYPRHERKISDSDDLESFEDFIKRIVSVDQRYLRNIYNIISKVPSIGNKVYSQKKPDSELTGNETPEMTFRYSKLIRKLARIANICARKSLSDVNGKFLKEISPIIKMYGYNWNDIYDCIMDS